MQMMEEKELCVKQTTTTTTTSLLGVQRDSQTISKFIRPPKIRIIHIYAPEVIQTDAANFRELVQRLTGMPTEDNCSRSRTTRKKSRTRHANLGRFVSSSAAEVVVVPPPKAKKMEVIRGGGFKDEGIWSGANAGGGGGFLGGFGELEGFMDQLNNNFHEFPLMIPVAASQYMDGYGD